MDKFRKNKIKRLYKSIIHMGFELKTFRMQKKYTNHYTNGPDNIFLNCFPCSSFSYLTFSCHPYVLLYLGFPIHRQ
jgi:hypothetical protein